MAHWSGTRSGWNTRGGTDADHLRIAQEMIREKMMATCQKLADKLGTEAYIAWVDAEITDTDSASAIIRKAEAKLAEITQ